MRKLILSLAALGLAACGAPSAEKASEAEEGVTVASQRVVCPTLQRVGRNASACGVGLAPDSTLTIDGAPATGAGGPLNAASAPDRPAQSLIVYPSPGGLFVLARACEGPAEAPGACDHALIIDRDTRVAQPIELPQGDALVWSPDNSMFALATADRILAVDAQSQRVTSFPEEDAGETWRVTPDSLRFTGNAILVANVSACRGAACAPAAERTISLD